MNVDRLGKSSGGFFVYKITARNATVYFLMNKEDSYECMGRI